MKSLKDLMAELGFDKDSSVNVQKAFIKNLIKSAQETQRTKTFVEAQKSIKQNKAKPKQSEQLSFDLSDDKKVS